MHWEDLGTSIDSAGFIILDGFTIPGQFIYGKGAASRSAVRVSKNEERPFVFSRVSLASAKVNKEMGMIVLKVKQIKRTTLTHAPNAPLVPPRLSKTRRTPGVEAVVG